jgi:hypothetical protein
MASGKFLGPVLFGHSYSLVIGHTPIKEYLGFLAGDIQPGIVKPVLIQTSVPHLFIDMTSEPEIGLNLGFSWEIKIILCNLQMGIVI